MRIQDRPTPKTTTAQCVYLGSTWEKAFKVMMANSARLEQERDHAIEALKAIANPIAAIQKAVPKGRTFNGAVAVQLAADPAHYQGIAQQALDEIERSKT